MGGFWAGAVPPWAYVVGACLWMGALLIGAWYGYGRGEKAADMEEERLLREQAKARRTHAVYRQGPAWPLFGQAPELAHDDAWPAWEDQALAIANPFSGSPPYSLGSPAITTGEIQAITDEMDAWLAQHVYAAPKDYGQWLEQVDGHGLRDG